MASPQKENGYTAIANELLDALARIRISGEARQVFDVILRKTYGYNKKADSISLNQFILGTRLKKSTVQRAINKLKLLNLILQKEAPIANLYSINKDFSTWRPLSKKSTRTPKRVGGVLQKDKKRTPKRGVQKTISKDNITKDNSEDKPRKDIQALFKLFYETINPNINFANKTDRTAAKWLIGKYGLEKTMVAAEYAISVQSDKYAPTITTPYQLKEKMASLAKYKLGKKDRKIWKQPTSSSPQLEDTTQSGALQMKF